MMFRPPPGWTEIPSRLDGIVVFGPPPPDDDAPDAPIATTCASCGAPMAFDPAKQALACTTCGSTQQAGPAVGSLASADGNEFTLEALRRGARGWGVARKVLHCDSCGSELLVEAGALTTTCPSAPATRSSSSPATPTPCALALWPPLSAWSNNQRERGSPPAEDNR